MNTKNYLTNFKTNKLNDIEPFWAEKGKQKFL